MLGYMACHIKTCLTAEVIPNAGDQSHSKTELDGWYADLSPEFSCYEDMYWALNCGGVGVGCRDQVVLKDYGADQLGYVLKETIATTDQQRTFTITHQVVEVTKTVLGSSLFDTPAVCQVKDIGYEEAKISAVKHGATAMTQPEANQEPAIAAPMGAETPRQIITRSFVWQQLLNLTIPARLTRGLP